MKCLYPLRAYRLLDGTVRICKRTEVMNGYPFEVPCNKCRACRLERSRQWAVRCMHEAALREENSYITLTFDEEHLPKHGSLDKHIFTKFMKRLRKHFPEKHIRYFQAGEYGDSTQRPHHHACLFGCDFSDDRTPAGNRHGYPIWSSHTLEKIWGQGLCEIGSLTFASAAYVARYIMKKQDGEPGKDKYLVADDDTGAIRELEPEYATMSRNPGLGAGWLEQYGLEVYKNLDAQGVVVAGKLHKPPRYYDNYMKQKHPELVEETKWNRQQKQKDIEQVPLAVMREIMKAKTQNQKRRLT